MLKETILTESDVLRPNLSENIVVIAATGALQEITIETKRFPLMPQRYERPRIKRGKANSFKNIAKTHLRFLSPERRLLFDR